MISPGIARELTLHSQAATNLKIKLDAWIKMNVPVLLQEPFSELGADSVDDLRYIKSKDLDKTGMPTLKKRKLFKQINIDAGGKLTLRRSLDQMTPCYIQIPQPGPG